MRASSNIVFGKSEAWSFEPGTSRQLFRGISRKQSGLTPGVSRSPIRRRPINSTSKPHREVKGSAKASLRQSPAQEDLGAALTVVDGDANA